MVRYSNERSVSVQEKKAGGEGFMTVKSIIGDKSEISNAGRLFGEITLLPGHSIGFHKHEKETELFCVIKGKAEYNDNGTLKELLPGDVAICPEGESHGVKNVGEEPLVLTALILNA